MTDTTPRKRGPKKRYPTGLVLVQAHVTPELRQWFEALPGNSNHERMQWLRERMAEMQTERPASHEDRERRATMKRIRSIVISAALLAAIAASSVSAQPQRNPPPVPQARICTAWLNQCVAYRYIFGIRYCTVHQLTCIRWL